MSGQTATGLRRHVPNALTLLRFAAVPVFAVLFLSSGNRGAAVAGVFFAGAAATDQLDGWLARRWHVESRFGRIADPLADRVMISLAAILLWRDGRLPWAGALIVLSRDLVLVAGYQLLSPRGVTVDVSRVGKVGTWVLYAALTGLIVTAKGTRWPLWMFWTGVAIAVVAAAQYVLTARRVLAGSEGTRALEAKERSDSQAEVDPSRR